MGETVEQYMQRIMNTLGGRDPLTVLRSTEGELSALLDGEPETILTKRPAPDKWSIGEILAHLAEAEMVIGVRVRLVLGNNGTPIQAFDQDVWAQRYKGYPITMARDLYRSIRQANLALYQSLSAEEWERYGMHSERGKETVRRIAQMHAGHDINHLKQIEAILGKAERAKAS